MGDAHAVVVGAGIGGLCAAIGLRRRGWHVTVLERAPAFGQVGAGLTLMANGLRGLDLLGVGEAVRAQGRVDAPGGLRTPSGRWLSRVDGPELTRRLGTPALGIHRATLHRVLVEALPAGTVRTGADVVDVVARPSPRVVVDERGERATLGADLVVAADGVHSRVRAHLWPELPGAVYAGVTAWRAVTAARWHGEPVTSVTWGRGAEFGMVPLGDGRVYWYGAVNAAPGRRAAGGDEMRAVRTIFGGWHEPVAALLDATEPASVLRNDLVHLGTPLPSYRRGGVALVGDAAHAMVPHLGQGANQAIEDAAVLAAVCAPGGDVAASLDSYDAARRPRSQRVARDALRTARLGQGLQHPLAVGLRDAVVRLTPSPVTLRSMARVARWDAPDVLLPAAG